MHAFILIAALLGATTWTAAAANETLRIGVIGPMSGPAAQWGVELARGAEMKADEINAAGGLKIGNVTYDIQIIPYDHKANAAEATTVVNRLVYQDKVNYIVGNAVGATTTAAQTITEPSKVLFLFVSWGKQSLGPKYPFSFRETFSDVEVVEPFYRWLKEHKKINTVALLDVNDQSGKATGASMVEAAKTLELKILADEYFDRATTDFYPLLNRILAMKPDYVDLGSVPPGTAGLLMKQLHEMGYRGPKGWVSGALLEPAIKIAGGEASDGLLAPWSANLEGKNVPPAVKEIVARYQKKYGELAGNYVVDNYVGLDIATRAMKAAGTIDTEKVAPQLAGKKFDSAWGPVVVGGKGTYGVDHQFLRPITITQYQKGQMVDVGSAMPRDLMPN
ncbi:MAG TPA: ABC transporter substrate-binding protein [Xanthobacteraceae bacterium]|jgi:branched-chain amino acid transport system substrate-binding protein